MIITYPDANYYTLPLLQCLSRNLNLQEISEFCHHFDQLHPTSCEGENDLKTSQNIMRHMEHNSLMQRSKLKYTVTGLLSTVQSPPTVHLTG